MNRITIFAHYDRDAVIDEYVLYYLRGLKEVAARVLFVSDAALPVRPISSKDWPSWFRRRITVSTISGAGSVASLI